MTHKSQNKSPDEAMIAYLAGDDAVIAAARRIWDSTRTLHVTTQRALAAQRHLQQATDDYAAAIRASRIPTEHVERIGAALMLRLGRTWLPGEGGDKDTSTR